jgi:hypothetical protein
MRHGGRVLHMLLALAVTLVLLAAVAAAGLSWRLAQGPLDLAWAIDRLEGAAASVGGGATIKLGGAALVWEGFQAGSERPLDIRLSDVIWRDANGVRIARIPEAAVALSVPALLRGRLRVRSVALTGPQLRIWRDAEGGLAVDAGTGDVAAAPAPPEGRGIAEAVTAALAELGHPAGRLDGPLSELALISVRDAGLAVVDRGLDTVWLVPHANLELRRAAQGGVVGAARLDVRLGETIAPVDMQLQVPPDGGTLRASATLGEIRPALIAAAVPKLAMLAAADLPVILTMTATLDPDLRHPSARLGITLGAGIVRIADGTSRVAGGQATLSGTLNNLDIAIDHLDLAPTPDGPRTRIAGSAHAAHTGSRIDASVALTLDRVQAADLPALWPAGVGGPGTRPWISENITAGEISNLAVSLALTMPDDFSDAQVTRIEGGMDGQGLTVHWLRPVPPAEGVSGHLRLLTGDSLEITIASGQQTRMAGGPPITVRAGTVTLTGLSGRSQFADIDVPLSGPVPELLALLRHPKLTLLDKRPLPVKDPAGQFAGRLAIDRLPLKNDLDLDDVHIRASARLSNLHLGGLAGGRDLDGGPVDLTASNDGLKASGNVSVAGLPVALTLEQDFRAGPPSQVILKAGVAGNVTAAQLASLGADAGDALGGRLGLRADYSQRRNGRSDVTVHADLAAAEIKLAALAWRKPPGAAGTLDARIQLDRDTLAGIDLLRASGEGFNVDGTLEAAGGKPRLLRLRTLALGRAIQASGEIGFPATPDAPWNITLQGALLDASSALTHSEPTPGPKQRGPRWNADVRFEKIVTANDTALFGVSAKGQSDGWINPQLQAIGRTQADGGDFRLAIVPDGKGRTLTASADDAGRLLRALDIVSDMRDGRMKLGGAYDDTRADHRLEASAEISDFALRNGAGFGKLLQAFSVYGLIDVVRTPDLAFNTLVAPFRMAGDTLELRDARAFNSSLGITAKGRFDLASRVVDLQGTIVPAYFLNSLLGKIPLIGKLLSPEKDGGLFAASWSLRGGFDDPDVGVNPLAAITPGFLRGIFGVFDGNSSIPVPGDPPPSPRRMPSNQPQGGQDQRRN